MVQPLRMRRSLSSLLSNFKSSFFKLDNEECRHFAISTKILSDSRTLPHHDKYNSSIDTRAESDGNANVDILALRALRNQIITKKPLSKNKQKELSRKSLQYEAILNSFSEFYSRQYGKERWKSLFEAMCKPAKHVAMVNNFASSESIERFLNSITQASIVTSDHNSIQDQSPKKEIHFEKIKFVDIPCYSISERFSPPFKDEKGVMTYYLLDAASVMVVKALDVKPTDNILDLCAAPGGKSLAILQHLLLSSKVRRTQDVNDTGDGAPDIGHLTSNELSPTRRRRLKQVITDYVPSSYQHKIKIASEFQSFSMSAYDKILVDAPCSSERHLLSDPTEFSKWKVSRTKNNAKKQYKMLLDAVKGLHIGGILVYATCSISKLENDEVVKRLLENSWVPLEEVGQNFHWEIGEKTEKGWIVLPDKCDGWGPLYFSVLKRVGDGEFRRKELTKFNRKAKYETTRNLHEDTDEEFDDYNADTFEHIP
ncbi:524_t:CDS:2 [Acaulospora morrowiae]|uniref:NOL1/NOP2/Sun domain family member 4 n=1 Tax=Acaulospora morrowiae TaxID=94023 RepID=A0A9N9CEK0_9GLOM|nr:524_t:CDS:2 [Acaulospora morrowiae]